MSAVKLLFCIGLLFCGVLTGLHLSQRLKKRRDILCGFSDMLSGAAIRIDYTAGDLYEVFADNFAGYSFTHGRPFDSQWEELVRQYSAYLNRDDCDLLLRVGGELGASDRQAQQRQLALYTELLGGRIRHAEAELENKAKLCRILPFAASAALAILII